MSMKTSPPATAAAAATAASSSTSSTSSNHHNNHHNHHHSHNHHNNHNHNNNHHHHSPSTTSSKSLHHVNFNPESDQKITEKKKRYLTAKYGQHQMNLIKKRLKVEMWMYEQLQYLFDSDDNFNDIEIDLDEVLDLEGKTRKQWLREKLIDAKKSKDVVEKFIVELLEKANTL